MVSAAHVEAVATALAFLEDNAAYTRRQEGGVRRRVETRGFAVATFVHRTSREGDPQLHTHCLIPNVVEREDGSHVAFNAHPLHEWAKAAGSVFQAELQRRLTRDLGVEWGPDRHGCREMIGFSAEQLRAFSKRTLQIESELERKGQEYESPAARMQANDRASLATRRPKDRLLTPALLADEWNQEARTVGLDGPEQTEGLVVGRNPVLPQLSTDDVFAALIDPDTGLCAKNPRFGDAHVYEQLCALSAGRWDVAEVRRLPRPSSTPPTSCASSRGTAPGVTVGSGRPSSTGHSRTTCSAASNNSPVGLMPVWTRPSSRPTWRVSRDWATIRRRPSAICVGRGRRCGP